MGTERFAIAMTTSNLAHKDEVIMPVDHVAAMSAATNLGSDLFRARDYDYFALRRAVLLLASKAIRIGKQKKLHLSRDLANKFAVAVIRERIDRNCRNCTGAGVVMVADLKIVCPTCDGTAVHSYHDGERARLCGIKRDDWHQWESRYLMVMGIMLGHDIAVMLATDKLGA
ncbi:MAG: hypothetical protein WC073_11280 [Sterolibacterium sp.]